MRQTGLFTHPFMLDSNTVKFWAAKMRQISRDLRQQPPKTQQSHGLEGARQLANAEHAPGQRMGEPMRRKNMHVASEWSFWEQ